MNLSVEFISICGFADPYLDVKDMRLSYPLKPTSDLLPAVCRYGGATAREPAAGRKPRASGERELHNSVYRELRFHNEMTQL
ncbi:hypothetical protein EVAR_54674_1 [Eumeta japonica]|uniref:Uncharacterized protein n=1 Tax=Eumeta variegata TaxID=151549 RepID=A0A4C1X761_EUMVA|nr:hypothetical protein EVAR_54674_1 [Eumeta japonica]